MIEKTEIETTEGEEVEVNWLLSTKKTSILLSDNLHKQKKRKNINQSLFVENKISVCTMNMCSGIKWQEFMFQLFYF